MSRQREPIDGMGVIMTIYVVAMLAISAWLAWLTVRGV